MKQIDRLRNMNAEELANAIFLRQKCNFCLWGESVKIFGCNGDCHTGIKAWLESEVKNAD